MSAIFGYDSGIRETEDKLDPLGAAISKPIKDLVWKKKPADPVYEKPASAPLKVTTTEAGKAQQKQSLAIPENQGNGLQIY